MRFSAIPYLVWLILLCTNGSVKAQNTATSRLYDAIQKEFVNSKNSNYLNLLKADKSVGFSFNSEVIKVISTQYPRFLELEVNLSTNHSFTIQLIRNDQLIQDISYIYHGVISGQPNSIVNLSIESETIYLDITNDDGSFRIYPDPYQKKKANISYAVDEKSKGWTCDNTEDTVKEQVTFSKVPKKSIKSNAPDTLDIYIEADHAIYLNQGSEISAQEYVARVMNRVASIYFNEGIILRISDLKVWDTADPYDYTTSLTALNSFLSQIPCEFDGDLAHLISGRALQLGGVAYVQGILNRNYAGGFSNVHFDEQQQPYSWDVNVIAHEIGHNLGSRHTHDCVWGPNANVSIDGCYVQNPCNQSPIPESGGTIMSYCHLLPIGIDLSLGFGEQPGNVIRYILAQKDAYLGYCPYSAQSISINDSILTIPNIDRGFGAHQPDANHAYWLKMTPEHDAVISLNSCDQGIDTRLFVYEGDCRSLVLIATSDDDCHSASGLYYAAEIEDIYLIKGRSYYIEWDNRWSSSGFTALLAGTYIIDPCDNGIQDGEEMGIDCGGPDCSPCDDATRCTPEVVLPPVIVHKMECKTNDLIAYHGSVQDTADLLLTSPISVELSAGFEIMAGGELTIMPESCTEN